MMPVAYLLLLFLADKVYSRKVCTYQDVVNYLNLTRGNDVYTLTRPVLDYTHRTEIQLNVFLFSILAVNEKMQTFTPVLWIETQRWNNERIFWDPSRFCGISQISLPKEMVWKPDLFIYEMTQNDESFSNPYLHVTHEGILATDEDLKVVSSCKMDVHKFPFDTQSCNITIGTVIHAADEVQLIPFSNSSRLTQFSREVMQTQGEWEFISLTVTNGTHSFYEREWEKLIYTITMRRRPLLHVINFLLPILFFLCLDLASFFISDQRGEKLGFKVTVLLAVTVMQLILHDILPSMSNRTPLIAMFCIVIFALMLLSLLVTILVTYLMEKDSPTREKCKLRGDCEDKQDDSKPHICEREEKGQDRCVCICGVSGDTPCELLPVPVEVANSRQTGESHVLLLILEELRELQKSLAVLLSSRREGGKPGYWTRVATRINTAFFIFYVITVSLFLLFMYKAWST